MDKKPKVTYAILYATFGLLIGLSPYILGIWAIIPPFLFITLIPDLIFTFGIRPILGLYLPVAILDNLWYIFFTAFWPIIGFCIGKIVERRIKKDAS